MPRRIWSIDASQIRPGRHEPGNLLHMDFPVGRTAEIADDLAKPEHAHRQDDEVEAVTELREHPGMIRAIPEFTSVPTKPSRSPSRIMPRA